MGEALKAKLLLNSGHLMPQVGFGTYKLRGTDVHKCVKAALTLGYQLIDTSCIFNNDPKIRVAIAGVSRDSFFLTTKVAFGDFDVNNARKSALRSLNDMKLKYVDLLMLQSPLARGFKPKDERNTAEMKKAWKELEVLQSEGMTRSIGVANFDIHHIEELLQDCKVHPAVNQVEMHPLVYNAKLVTFCQQKKIAIQASSPLARGQLELLNNPTICSIAARLGKTSSQVALRWGFQKGFSVIPKSINLDRIKANTQLDFNIPLEDMLLLDQISTGLSVGWNTSEQ